MATFPSTEIEAQAERLIHRRVSDFMRQRDRATKEVDADAIRRNVARSGAHFAELMDAWIPIHETCANGITDDLIDLVRTHAGLTRQSADWIKGMLSTHLTRLADGAIRGILDMAERRAVRHLVPRKLQQATLQISSLALQRVEIALGDAELAAQAVRPNRDPPAPDTLTLDGLHPRIREVAERLYRDGHYRQAILDAYIALIEEVRKKSGIPQDGTDLMNRAFSARNPMLAVSDDPDERLGFMWLYAGAVMAIRNPKSHRLIEHNDPQRALEWLAFASVLLRVLGDSRKEP